MRRPVVRWILCAGALASGAFAADAPVATRLPAGLVPDLTQPIDADATAQHPRSTRRRPTSTRRSPTTCRPRRRVPAPSAVLGDVAGAPGILPYTADVHRYFRLLAAASPRVRVFTIGTSEEGRERIVVAISLRGEPRAAEENDARLAQLADPRTLGLDDARAERAVRRERAGLLHHRHHPLARDRLADGADGARLPPGGRREPLHPQTIREQRDHPDHAGGRGRRPRPHGGRLPLAPRASRGRPGRASSYWGHYVAHDNNRDAMGLTLSLSRQVLDTYLGWHAQVLHDLHESVPFLYDNTVGDGPYNAWVDPHPHQRVAAVRLDERGRDDQARHAGRLHPRRLRHLEPRLPDVHGGDAQRRRRGSTRPSATAAPTPRCASSTPERVRPAPGTARIRPSRTVSWSQRNNNNYQQTGLLVSLAFAAENREQLLRELLGQEQALDREAAARGAGGLRPARRRPAARARRPSCCACSHLPARRDPRADRAVHRRAAGSGATGDERTSGRHGTRRRSRQDAAKAGARPAGAGQRLPGRQLCRAHGSALQPHRRRAARPPVLEPRRSAEAPLRRHRLELRRTLRRRGACASPTTGPGARR